MKQAIYTWLRANAGKHTEAILIAAACLFIERTYMQEHEARLIADANVRVAEATIGSLQKQQSDVAKEAQTKVIVLQRAAETVKTPAQATASLQADREVKAALPTLQTLPDAPDRVSVNSLELFKGVNACEQCSVNLTAKTKELDIEKQINTEKDAEIKALKKPSFLRRLGRGLRVIGCSAGGAAVGSLAGTKGAAIGAAAGAGICQTF